jgi:integrase
MKSTNNSGTTGNLLAQLDKLHRHNRQGSFKTKERYYEAMKRFCNFVSAQFKLQKLANISGKHIIAYVANMQERELAASTLKTELAAIRFWHDKVFSAKHLLPTNDTLDLEKRTFGAVDRAWTQGEFNRIIALCWKLGHEDYASILTLARYAGLRIHECFRIDISIAENAIKTGEITIKGKGGKIRTIPINKSIEIELQAMLDRTERGHKLFVPDDEKTHHAIKRLQQFIINHRKQVQDPDSIRPMTFHGLRHFYAAEWFLILKDVGCDDFDARKKVSQWLGHERDSVTKIYLTSLPRMEGR